MRMYRTNADGNNRGNRGEGWERHGNSLYILLNFSGNLKLFFKNTHYFTKYLKNKVGVGNSVPDESLDIFQRSPRTLVCRSPVQFQVRGQAWPPVIVKSIPGDSDVWSHLEPVTWGRASLTGGSLSPGGGRELTKAIHTAWAGLFPLLCIISETFRGAIEF